ncbi:MAG: hypothetical protein AAFO73_01180 [Pseudomonadota bacterium]
MTTTQARRVRAALSSVLASEQFSSSAQLSDFLSFIVEKTLRGEADDIKAYTIAVDALGRSEDFDPQTNAAVRVAAGRLRQALALHNASTVAETGDVVISLETGTYVPSFTFHDPATTEPPKGVAVGPSVTTAAPEKGGGAISGLHAATAPVEGATVHVEGSAPTGRARLRFAHMGIGFGAALLLIAGLVIGGFASGLFGPQTMDLRLLAGWGRSKDTAVGEPATGVFSGIRPSIRADLLLPKPPYPKWFVPSETAEALRVTIARFDDLRFTGSNMSEANPPKETIKTDYQVVITAYPRGDGVRFYSRLIRVADSQTIWSTQRLFTAPTEEEPRSVPRIIGSIFSSIGSPYGVIYADIAKRSLSAAEKPTNPSACLALAYAYFYSENDARHKEARDCTKRHIDGGSRLAVFHALNTFLLLDEYREGRNPTSSDPLSQAAEMAAAAVRLAPQSARAHQAQFAVFKVRRLYRQARVSGLKAVELNPYDTDILADYGAWLVSIGDITRGRALLTRADDLLGVRAAWLEFYLYLSARLDGKTTEAARIARTADVSRSPLLALAAALGAADQSDTERKMFAVAALNRQAPRFLADPADEFRRRGFHDRVIDVLVKEIKKAHLIGG